MFPEQSPRFSPRSLAESSPKSGSGAPAIGEKAGKKETPLSAWISDLQLERASLFSDIKEPLINRACSLLTDAPDDRFIVEVQKNFRNRFEGLREDFRDIVAQLDIIESDLLPVLPREFGGLAEVANREKLADIFSSRLSPALNRLLLASQQSVALNLEVIGLASTLAQNADTRGDEDLEDGGVVFAEYGSVYSEFESALLHQSRKVANSIAALTARTADDSIDQVLVPIGPWLIDKFRGGEIPTAMPDEEWRVFLRSEQNAISALYNARHLLQRVTSQALQTKLHQQFFERAAPIFSPGEFPGSQEERLLNVAADFGGETALSFDRDVTRAEDPRRASFSVKIHLPHEFETALRAELASEESLAQAIKNESQQAGIPVVFRVSRFNDGVEIRAEFFLAEERETKVAPLSDVQDHSPFAEEGDANNGETNTVWIRSQSPRPPLGMKAFKEAFYTTEGCTFVRDCMELAHQVAERDPAVHEVKLLPYVENPEGGIRATVDAFANRSSFIELTGNYLLFPEERKVKSHPLNFPIEYIAAANEEGDGSKEEASASENPARLGKLGLRPRRIVIENGLEDDVIFRAGLLQLVKHARLIKMHFENSIYEGYRGNPGLVKARELVEHLHQSTEELRGGHGLQKIYVVDSKCHSHRSSLEHLSKTFNFYDSKGELVGRSWYYSYPPEMKMRPTMITQSLLAHELEQGQALVSGALDRAARSHFESFDGMREFLLSKRIDPCESLIRAVLLDPEKALFEGERPLEVVSAKLTEFWNSPFVWVDWKNGRLAVRHRGDMS